MQISCVELFCGAGGLTYGLQQSGIDVRAGVDNEPWFKWSYEANTGVPFIKGDVSALNYSWLEDALSGADIRLIAGCAPCQPFSTYGHTRRHTDGRWQLISSFAATIQTLMPELVTMENVPGVIRHDSFRGFLRTLHEHGYEVCYEIVDCQSHGVPQHRRRLVLIASRMGPAMMPHPCYETAPTVHDAIANFPALEAGEADQSDRLHRSSNLSPLNLERIRHSRPGGSWRDWPDRLITDCHKASAGRSYPSVYGRMEWGRPAPTITTQCHLYGSGRFGHPSQDRAISLREAATLQSFPGWWQFVSPVAPVHAAPIARAIGNAVPPRLGQAIGATLLELTRSEEAA